MNTIPHTAPRRPQSSVSVLHRPLREAAIPDENDEFDSEAGEVRRMIELNGMIGLDADAFLADAG